jgi:UDP-N-acetylmuramate--alanine ligase
MTLFRTGDPRPIHLMGIAGAGMSALALIARHRGVAITGCDSDTSGAGSADLTALGVPVWRGHDPSHVDGARAVIVTAAVPRDHPELERARALGLPVVRRADALGELVGGVGAGDGGGTSLVAVAGTHGKTTTTVMVTEALTAAGRNPTGLAGGRVAAWGGNARVGGDRLFVVEADEYDKAFLALRPTIAVVNNVEADHLECYGSIEALEQAFAEFAGRAERVIVGADDAGAERVALRVEAPVWRVGHGATADVRIRAVRLEPGGSRATITLPGGHALELELAVPGLHNVRNAAAALAVLQALGADVQAGARALAGFHGVGRRFERLGKAGGVTVVDDYAHHPTEVAATLAAARQAFPGQRLLAVFQPHLFSRTALHGEALGKALAAADVVVVAPIYAAREQPQAGVTHHLVVRGATRAGAATVAVRDRAGLTTHVARAVRHGDVVFTLGAGDITRVGPELLEILRAGRREQGAVA